MEMEINNNFELLYKKNSCKFIIFYNLSIKKIMKNKLLIE